MDQAVGIGLRIHLLGQPRFFYHGESFAFHSRPRVLALLIFLLLHRGAHLTRDLVAFSLWPEDSETEARGKLRRHLHHLTSALPPSPVPYISSAEDTICWNDAAGVRVDVDVFEGCIGDESRWAEAVELYEGDLAPAVYDDWIAPFRERVRREYVATLERLLFRARSRREFALATAYAERILANDPWREDTLRQLASIRYESGDRAGAVRGIDVFAKRLAAEMSWNSCRRRSHCVRSCCEEARCPMRPPRNRSTCGHPRTFFPLSDARRSSSNWPARGAWQPAGTAKPY